MVYRLVWAMEAVRVRAVATGDVHENLFNGRAATAVETGSPFYSASLLIHCGLASRVAAIKAVQELNGDFRDMIGMRQWIRSAPVVSRSNDPDWPSADTAGVWLEFVQSLEHEASAHWEAVPFRIGLEWLTSPLAPGTPVRISNGTRVHTITWEPVGDLRQRLEFGEDGILTACVGLNSSSIDGKFLGPRRRRTPPSGANVP